MTTSSEKIHEALGSGKEISVYRNGNFDKAITAYGYNTISPGKQTSLESLLGETQYDRTAILCRFYDENNDVATEVFNIDELKPRQD